MREPANKFHRNRLRARDRPRVRALLLLVAFGFLAACAHLDKRPDLPVESAIKEGDGGRLDRAFAPLEDAHPGQSAFRLLIEGTEAFVTRAQSARVAVRSLDVQTYIWHSDLTGKYLLETLLGAADRGVKVRVLVDDIDARAKNSAFAALAAHSNISVRLFNPFASRSGALQKMGEAMTSFDRLNHRMHNKTWIADNRIALVGGRNIGDEYFSANDGVNFVDLDFAMVGPVVRDISASFDEYWNSPSAYPIQVLDPKGVNADALAKLRELLGTHLREAEQSKYATELKTDDAVERLVKGERPMEWATTYAFVADNPLKATMKENDVQRSRVAQSLFDKMATAKTDLKIVSPYFVPGKEGTRRLTTAAKSASVELLTNSLSASDVAAVHGGYSEYREELLQGGVALWELKPLAGDKKKSSVFGSTNSSLHTKAVSIDDAALFVGSYNLDPRSTWLNCEQGVWVDDALLARQFAEIFAKQTAGDRAWRVTLVDKDLHWSDGAEHFDSDPKASLWRRFQAWFARVLGLEAQL